MGPEGYTFGYSAAAVALMAFRTAESHAAFLLRELKPQMSLLDVGCGPGTITLGLARAVHPGTVVGIELDLEQTRHVAEQAHDEGLDLSFARGDVYDLPYSDDSFDAVFLSAVVGNLRHPIDGFRELYRVLRPGGLIGVKEFDHGGNLAFPEPEHIKRVNELANRLRLRNGHDPDSGRKVSSYLDAAGFARIRAKATFENLPPAPGIQGSPLMESIVREEWGPKFVELGWATQQEIDQWIEQSAAHVRSGTEFTALAWVEALAFKPTG